jgi:hypothetical protein
MKQLLFNILAFAFRAIAFVFVLAWFGGCDIGDLGRTANPFTEKKLYDLGAQFMGHYRQYTKLPTAQANNSYLKGKAIVLDRYSAEMQLVGLDVKLVRKTFLDATDGYNLSSVYLDLSESLRASKPDEVSTVILLDYDLEQVGTYGGGSRAALKWKCTMQVIDIAAGTFSCPTRSFSGSAPPSSIGRYAGDQPGNKPDKEIVKFIMALPRVSADATAAKPST